MSSARVAPVGDVEATAAPHVPLENVFAFHREKPAPWVVRALFLLVWMPIGAPLFVVRLVLLVSSMLTAFSLPNSISRRLRPYWRFVVFPLLGWVPWVTGRKHLTNTPNPKIITSNHPSNYDPLLATANLGEVTALTAVEFKLFWEFFKSCGLLRATVYTNYFGAPRDRANVRDQILQAVSPNAEIPLLLYPEGTVNNCDTALLRYERFVFSLGVPIVPVASRLVNPWPFNFFVVSASPVSNLIWMLFLPFLAVRHDVLPAVSKAAGEGFEETDGDFAKRVCAATAARLGVDTVDENWLSKSLFMQALGLHDYDVRYWEKARTVLEDERTVLQERQQKPQLENKAHSPRNKWNRNFVLKQLEKPFVVNGTENLYHNKWLASNVSDVSTVSQPVPLNGLDVSTISQPVSSQIPQRPIATARSTANPVVVRGSDVSVDELRRDITQQFESKLEIHTKQFESKLEIHTKRRADRNN